ncbi:MAG: serine hydrolase [Chitinophagaceae bacterium]
MKKLYFIACFLVLLSAGKQVCGQPITDNLLKTILLNRNHELLNKVLKDPVTYRYQIIYTQINRDEHNLPEFKNYYYNFDAGQYFNPASTVKLPLALLALEKLHTIHNPAVNKFTPVQFDSSYAGQITAYKDSTSSNGLPSIAHYIKKAFLISDNDAYNRLYQFIGQQHINRTLHDKGYTDVRITRQFLGFDEDQNRHTNPVRFIKEDGGLLFRQDPAYNTDSFDFSHTVKMGKAYYDRKDSLVNEPIDFTRVNNISLKDLQQILQSALFPLSVPPVQRFNLDKDDQAFFLRYLSQFPSETSYPKYDSSKFYDSYVKFFMRDSSHHLPADVRVFNKVGWAYGFLIDVSYIADFRSNIEFMLSAIVYVNSDEVQNDNKYDYDTIGYPFLYEVGQTIYQYELNRKRLYKPDLSVFKVNYDHRDAGDIRASVKEAEN